MRLFYQWSVVELILTFITFLASSVTHDLIGFTLWKFGTWPKFNSPKVLRSLFSSWGHSVITFLVIMWSMIVCYSKKLIIFCVQTVLKDDRIATKKKSSCFSHYHLIVCLKKMFCSCSHERPITSCNLVLTSNKNPGPTPSGLPPYLLSFGWVKKP